ncbi:class E sortase [Streptomyces sp. NPDC007205]|uniref:class E sortase n=1 Tax=Streptomyces sp. NPDC007205 TaxID=3154316 RepID=UPI0033EDE354
MRITQQARPARALLAAMAGLVLAAGLVLGSYTAWLIWGTDPQPSRPQLVRTARIERDLTRSSRGPGASPKSSTNANAVMRIPALGSHWAYPVYNGTTDKQLAKGLGHYTSTASPGEIGNYAVAGHRSSLSGFEPFADLPDRVKPGDKIIVTAPTGRYTYVVTSTQRVSPDADWVLRPDQGHGANPRDRLITLTTCTPRYGSTGRFIVYGRLTSHRSPSDGL